MIRRDVRRTIEGGSTSYGEVEEYHLGLATVRLGKSGARLTNISTLGLTVESGQQVIVDFSAGPKPIIRPIITEETTEELPLSVHTIIETPIESVDIGGFFVWENINFNYPKWYIYHGIPHRMRFGAIDPDWDNYGCYWNSGGTFNPQGVWGAEHIDITVSGKYIITTNWNDFITQHTVYSGHQRLRIIRKSATGQEFILGEMRGRDCEGYDNQPGIILTILALLTAGDKIYMELYYTYPQATYWPDNYGYYAYNTRGLGIQYITNSSGLGGDTKSRFCSYVEGV
jgi:hypothetical protein